MNSDVNLTVFIPTLFNPLTNTPACRLLGDSVWLLYGRYDERKPLRVTRLAVTAVRRSSAFIPLRCFFFF